MGTIHLGRSACAGASGGGRQRWRWRGGEDGVEYWTTVRRSGTLMCGWNAVEAPVEQ